jgi:hypothetical protein
MVIEERSDDTPPRRRKSDVDNRETLDHKKIALLTTIRALCVVIIVIMSILAVVLGYTLSSVNNGNTRTERVTRIVCGVLAAAPIELPVDCKEYVVVETNP